MSRIAIYPGSFDPITNGHASIILRGLNLFDELIVAVTDNSSKKHLFPLAERLSLINGSLQSEDTRRLRIISFENKLLAKLAEEHGACAILRGLRAVSDFEYEFQMAQANHALAPKVETVFVMTQDDYFFVSSSMVREISKYGGDVKKFVSPCVEQALIQKFKGG